jgi:hypothetical protein
MFENTHESFFSTSNDENSSSSSVLIDTSTATTSLIKDLEFKLNKTFDEIHSILNQRKETLLSELKQSLAFNDFEALNLNELLSLIRNFGCLKTNSSIDNKENSLIIKPLQNKDSLSSLFKLTGRGLKQCLVNEEASFTLSLKSNSQDEEQIYTYSSLNQVSLLDIFIINIDTNETNKIPFSNLKKSSSSNINNKQLNKCNCDCRLECVGEGSYEIKYKLDKKGAYSLNVLLNKKHLNGSPFKLLCLENSNNNNKITKNATNLRNQPLRNSQSSQPVVMVKKFQSNFNIPASKSSNFKLNVQKTLPLSTKLNKNRPVAMLNSEKKPTALFNKNTSTLSLFSTKSPSPVNSARSNIATDLNNSSSSSSASSGSNSNPLTPSHSKINISSYLENFNDLTEGKQEDDFLFQIGRRGRGTSEFMNPQAVCATSDSIYVTDSNNQKIEAFAHNGEYKFTLGGSLLKDGPQKVKRPIGVDSTSDGKILVVDYEFKCVNVYEDESGAFLKRICQNKLLGPKGICINRAYQNQIVIADSKANAVCIFDSEGRFLSKFGNLGNKNENFAGPQYVSCNSQGDILVTDFYNHCIKVFDHMGRFKFSFGSNGCGTNGQFNGPTGIATDGRDNIIVVDWGNSRIQVGKRRLFVIDCKIFVRKLVFILRFLIDMAIFCVT